jgi:hypothetical protein
MERNRVRARRLSSSAAARTATGAAGAGRGIAGGGMRPRILPPARYGGGIARWRRASGVRGGDGGGRIVADERAGGIGKRGQSTVLS